MKIQIKLFLILVLILTASFSFAQEKFQNEKLVLINDIVHKIKRDKIISFLNKRDFETESIKKVENFAGFEENLVFICEDETKGGAIEIFYGKNNKVLQINYDFVGSANYNLIAKELSDKKYKSTIDEGGERSTWIKSESNTTFIISLDEENNLGNLIYRLSQD